MDSETYATLSQMKLPSTGLIELKELEECYAGLREAKKNRSRIEYYFTCTPSLILFILNKIPQGDVVSYLDSDIYFFSDPSSLFKELGNGSVGIIEHSFSIKNRVNLMQGIYNVGLISVRRTAEGFACIEDWRGKCDKWCYDRVEENRFADQKYLDDWPSHFNSVVVLKNKGANLAIWNLDNYSIYADKKAIWVDDQPLIFFHFHGLKHLFWRLYDTGMGFYKFKITEIIRVNIYAPYLKVLLREEREILSWQAVPYAADSIRKNGEVSILGRLFIKARRIVYVAFEILIRGNYVLAPRTVYDSR